MSYTNLEYHNYSHEEWAQLAILARQQSVLAGFYNDNYRLVRDGRALLFRFAKKGTVQYDPKPFAEHDVYNLIDASGISAPKLLYVSTDMSFQVHEFIQGSLIDEICPPGQKITQHHINEITSFYKKIVALDLNVSNVISTDWPQKGPPLIFFEKILEKSWLTYEEQGRAHREIYDFLGVPKDPFEQFLIRAGQLTKRPWRLIHSDIHRANMIEQENGRLVIIDWELALYGDILYCIASHLHRCRFFADEKEAIATSIYKALPEDFQKNFMKDLAFYLDFEALNSVITDTVRFPNLIKDNSVSAEIMEELSAYYADSLNRVSSLIGTRTTTPEEALKWFHEWKDT